MKHILSGTDRPGSNTLKLAKFVQGVYKDLGEEVEIIDLNQIRGLLHSELHQYGKPTDDLKVYIDKINKSEGLIVVVPEYNGSMPGILKYFIDYMKYPDSFEFRPVCFIGLGGIFGGLRPVEHLQQVFGYRNAFVYPERIFAMGINKILDAQGKVIDPLVQQLLVKQAKGFQKFTRALQSEGLDANSILARPKV